LLTKAGPPEEDVALISDLLSLPASERHPLPNLSPQRRKERTLEALIRQLEGLARQQPVVMVFEDAHWIDPTSGELLDLTTERARDLPVLLIITFRPEFQPPWTGQPQVTMLALSRLDRRDRTALVAQIAGGKGLPEEVVAQIVDRTDGVPLFVEELTKSVLESGVSLVGIPTTLHDSLMARLDRLASVRLVAQTGAAIGREFSYQLLHAVSRLPDDELQAALARLVASELVFQRGRPPEAVYSFKHALVQDAAHQSLLRTTRQQLHAQIATALQIHYPEMMDSQPELFAQHYAEAGLAEKSVAYWSKAGHNSAARSALTEAAAQFQKGLDQLALLPDDLGRQKQELEFYSALGAVFQAVKGNTARETGDVRARALDLWTRLGGPSEFLRVPFAQSLNHLLHGELDLAHRLDEELLRLSRQRGDTGGLILSHLSCGRRLWFLGSFGPSRTHLEEVLTLYDPSSHGSLLHHADVHPRVISRAYLGDVLFCLGYPDQALMHSNAAVDEAWRLAHPPSLAGSLQLSALLLSLVVAPALDVRAKELTSLVAESDIRNWRGHETVYRGWVKVKNGEVADGIALLRGGVRGPTWTPYYLALLAQASEIAGKVEEARTLVSEALQVVKTGGLRWFEAELNRYKGQQALQQGHSEAAEELYRKALSIAEAQEAKMWELRAAVSLARLQRDQGRSSEARDLLASIYGWFTEGFDTADLKKAKALLEELG
jgi:tetratricopeptide (TPR) repeat protein